MSNLTELVKARVEPQLKRDLAAYARTTDRSEGAIVRAALKAYLPKERKR